MGPNDGSQREEEEQRQVLLQDNSIGSSGRRQPENHDPQEFDMLLDPEDPAVVVAQTSSSSSSSSSTLSSGHRRPHNSGIATTTATRAAASEPPTAANMSSSSLMMDPKPPPPESKGVLLQEHVRRRTPTPTTTTKKTKKKPPSPGKLIWEDGSYELYDYFMMHIGDLLQQHRLAAAYFRARYLFLSLIPSAGLTLVSGILAYIAGEGNRTLNIVIGSLSAFSTFLQAFSSYLRYGTRSEMHQVVASNLTDVHKGLRRKQLFAALATDSSNSAIRFQLEKFEERYNEAKRGCNSAIPIAIEKQYSKLEARFRLELDEVYRYETFPINCKYGYVLVWSLLCKILYAKITEHCLWPWIVVDHVDAVMVEAKKQLMMGGRADEATTARLSDLVQVGPNGPRVQAPS